jgi:putative spermidine/putrescine transport system substrate-binding protein
VLLGLGLQPGTVQAEESVVFVGWGGSIQAAQRKIFFDAFEKETGIKVIDLPDANLAKVKAMVESGDVQWDVVQCLGMWIPQGAKENLWEPLDYGVIDASNVPDGLKGEYGLGNSTYGMILAYNTELLGDHRPTSWKDLWDVDGMPGPRGMFDQPRYMLETALMADGVPMDKIYPLDVDRAFAKLDQIKDKVAVWWSQWPQVPILLASGEIEMSLISHTRILNIVKEENVPLAINWNQALMTVDYLAVPRGAKNAENAMKLIDWLTRADLQAELAKESGIGPSNVAALDELTDAEKENLPSYHYKKGEVLLFDNQWWADNVDQMSERWNAWKLK